VLTAVSLPKLSMPGRGVPDGLLERIENQEVHGITSTRVLTEMAHRIMAIEAITSPPSTGPLPASRGDSGSILPRSNNSLDFNKPLSESSKAVSRC
jgi:hypothetical protein